MIFEGLPAEMVLNRGFGINLVLAQQINHPDSSSVSYQQLVKIPVNHFVQLRFRIAPDASSLSSNLYKSASSQSASVSSCDQSSQSLQHDCGPLIDGESEHLTVPSPVPQPVLATTATATVNPPVHSSSEEDQAAATSCKQKPQSDSSVPSSLPPLKIIPGLHRAASSPSLSPRSASSDAASPSCPSPLLAAASSASPTITACSSSQNSHKSDDGNDQGTLSRTDTPPSTSISTSAHEDNNCHDDPPSLPPSHPPAPMPTAASTPSNTVRVRRNQLPESDQFVANGLGASTYGGQYCSPPFGQSSNFYQQNTSEADQSLLLYPLSLPYSSYPFLQSPSLPFASLCLPLPQSQSQILTQFQYAQEHNPLVARRKKSKRKHSRSTWTCPSNFLSSSSVSAAAFPSASSVSFSLPPSAFAPTGVHIADSAALHAGQRYVSAADGRMAGCPFCDLCC